MDPLTTFHFHPTEIKTLVHAMELYRADAVRHPTMPLEMDLAGMQNLIDILTEAVAE